MDNGKKKALLVINPISGTISKEGLAERVRSRLEPCGFEVEVVETTHAGHASQLATEAARLGYYAVLTAGGDGTVNEVASSLIETETALGILPYGSGNGLARHLYVNIDVDHALDVISKDVTQKCDYGTVNGRPFFCTFGLGFDAKVSHEFANASSRGILTYIKSALAEYMKFSPATYEIEASDGHQIHSLHVEAFLIAVCNASQYGNNAFIAPGASIRDGLLDIVVLHKGNQINRAIAGAQLFSGRIDHNMLIEKIPARKIKIRHLPGPAHIDGEPVTSPETIEIECHQAGLKMFIDPDKPPFKPFITPIESMRDDSSFLLRENVRIAKNNIRTLFNKK